MKPLRVLIVDDDKDFVESMGELIELAGHQTVLSYNGIEALKIFKQNNIDLILLDYKMPGLNGLETLLEIRKMNSTVPIIMMSAFADTDLIYNAKKQGAFEVLDKTIEINSLLRIFEKIRNKNKILLLDDDKDFADSLSMALSNEGYKVYVANNAEQAINCIVENDIELLVFDLRLNGKTGIDVWYSIREMQLDIPTIFISAYTDQFFDEIDKIMQITSINVMTKPFSPDRLISKIKNII